MHGTGSRTTRSAMPIHDSIPKTPVYADIMRSSLVTRAAAFFEYKFDGKGF